MQTLLIVDDDTMISKVMAQYFIDTGYETHAASSGEDALQYIKNDSIDYLITDQRLPGISGLDLLSAALRINPRIKCILMSGAIDFDIPENLAALGISEKNLVQKPERLSVIHKKLSEL